MSGSSEIYTPKNAVRIVTAGSLFDGHDVAINIMRRILQSSGCEVIHLGHNRSAQEIVDCAIQEDVQAIAVTSYQGGHVEFFQYMYDLLQEQGASHIKLFGGGGGTILPEEKQHLEEYGISRIYSPDEGRALGLQGMINDLIRHADFTLDDRKGEPLQFPIKEKSTIARLISLAENAPEENQPLLKEIKAFAATHNTPVLGVTGTGGSGKSSLVDELVRRFLASFKAQSLEKTIGIISVDPSKRKTGGALLGDRIRMNTIYHPQVYMRSLATREANLSLSKSVEATLDILKAGEFDLIILETSGIGQSDSEITAYSDLSLYVMTQEYGAASQLEKIDMLDFADLIVLNKSDKRGAEDALRDVKKQYRRNHHLWEAGEDDLPVYATIASQFNDPGTNRLYGALLERLAATSDLKLKPISAFPLGSSEKTWIIPPSRVRYLAEIAENNRNYARWVLQQKEVAQQLYGIHKTLEIVRGNPQRDELQEELLQLYSELEQALDPQNQQLLKDWQKEVAAYTADYYSFTVRDKEIKVKTFTESLSQSRIPKISLPKYEAWGDLLKWILTENVPGRFPFTSGVFPFKREGEDPTRMFAGEGAPERTNKRFHYLSRNLPAKRLSTAFDSVTLYGEDPDHRLDIYGKIGNSGVNICCLDDAKKLYSGFNLADAMTSVSMTINGPAATMTAFFMNAAIDQQCEIYIRKNGLEEDVAAKLAIIYSDNPGTRPYYNGSIPEGHDGLGLMLLGLTGDQVLPKEVYEAIKKDTLTKVRGTVQADILKEDQAQNTCIFSTEFSLRLMGDVQQYFIEEKIRNFYSVSISGYHIAEAGANPITQLALTLSNGFTYVEYYLSRGMDINQFAPNLSFFFSNGIDPEYAVIGRVARRIWAKAMKVKYGANQRSQMLKYHIQTSGRSLHAQEIDFNDIRTTLQALYAIYDNCNSLHTNAYDEAITTPTEASVRRAMAIQLIINKELGLAKNENPLQGSFIIEELTDLVEEAVYTEFDRISERGGVLGAMETMYQRGKIQEESLHYETLKHKGEYPIIGVNTFLSSTGSPTVHPGEVIRATQEEKEFQIQTLKNLHGRNDQKTTHVLKALQAAAVKNENLFERLMEAAKFCSLGQITHSLYEVGGQYRRNM